MGERASRNARAGLLKEDPDKERPEETIGGSA